MACKERLWWTSPVAVRDRQMSEGVKGRAWDSNRNNLDLSIAVVIGIDRYKNDSIRNLSTVVSDAGAVTHCSLMSTTIGKSQKMQFKNR